MQIEHLILLQEVIQDFDAFAGAQILRKSAIMVFGSPIWVFPVLVRVQVGSALHFEHQGLQSVRGVDGNEQESSNRRRDEGAKVGSLVGIDSNILDSSSSKERPSPHLEC
jgi:hypothetical protein